MMPTEQPVPDDDTPIKIAICCTCRLDDTGMSDWVSHHLELGFDHIFLYSDGNASSIKYLEEESPDKVTVVELEPNPDIDYTVQTYAHCYRENRRSFDWIAFIDKNDFFVLPHDNSIKSVFQQHRQYRKYEVVRVNLIDFSDFESLVRDFGIEYTPIEVDEDKAYKQNKVILAKSIVNCKSTGLFMGKYSPRRNWVVVSQCLPNEKPIEDIQSNSNTSGVQVGELDLDTMYITSNILEVRWVEWKKIRTPSS